MFVSIRRPILQYDDKVCAIYCDILDILYYASDKQAAVKHLMEYKEKQPEYFNRYFTFFNDPEGLHIFQRKGSDPSKIFTIELFTLS